jgi:hypothetical protein
MRISMDHRFSNSEIFRGVSWCEACDSLRKRNRCFTNCDDGFDLKPGDEVITADFTFAATVEVIVYCNWPVLVDDGFIQYEYLYRRN